jgi:hypothetical protein
MKKPQTNIIPLRANGLGIVGTKRNADHHAEAIKPFIERLEKPLETLGFETWEQGHNVHQFTNVEGTKYTLRAFTKNNEYVGIRLAVRVSRSHEIRLIDITNPDDCWRLLDFMRMLASPAKGNRSGVMCDKAA